MKRTATVEDYNGFLPELPISWAIPLIVTLLVAISFVIPEWPGHLVAVWWTQRLATFAVAASIVVTLLLLLLRRGESAFEAAGATFFWCLCAWGTDTLLA